MKNALKITGKILSWIITVLLILILAWVCYQKFSGNVPSVFGYRVLTILTGSMEPEIHVGEVVIVKETESSDINEGDVVTYLCTSGEMEGNLITHKVITAPYESSGETYIVTKGTANEADDGPVNIKNVVGKVIFVSSFLGSFYSFFQSIWGLLILIIPLLIMFFTELVNVFKLYLTKDDYKE